MVYNKSNKSNEISEVVNSLHSVEVERELSNISLEGVTREYINTDALSGIVGSRGYRALGDSVVRVLCMSSVVSNVYEEFLVCDSLKDFIFKVKFEGALLYFLDKACSLGLVSSGIVLARSKGVSLDDVKYHYILQSELVLYNSEVVVLERGSSDVFSGVTSLSLEDGIAKVLSDINSNAPKEAVFVGMSEDDTPTSLILEEGTDYVEDEAPVSGTSQVEEPSVTPSDLGSTVVLAGDLVTGNSLSLEYASNLLNSSNVAEKHEDFERGSGSEGLDHLIGDSISAEPKVTVILDDNILPNFGGSRDTVKPSTIGSLSSEKASKVDSFVQYSGVNHLTDGIPTPSGTPDMSKFTSYGTGEVEDRDNSDSHYSSRFKKKHTNMRLKGMLGLSRGSKVLLAALLVAGLSYGTYAYVPTVRKGVDGSISAIRSTFTGSSSTSSSSTDGSGTSTTGSSQSGKLLDYSPSVTKLFTNSMRKELVPNASRLLTEDYIKSLKGMLASEGLTEEALASETLLLDLLPTYFELNIKLDAIGTNTDISYADDVNVYKSVRNFVSKIPNPALKSGMSDKFTAVFTDYEIFQSVIADLSMYPVSREVYAYLDEAITGMSDEYSSGLKSYAREYYEGVYSYVESLGYWSTEEDISSEEVPSSSLTEPLDASLTAEYIDGQ